MAETNAKLNVTVALKSVIKDGEATMQWLGKYAAGIATLAASMTVFAGKQGIEFGSRITDLANQSQLGTEAFQVFALAASESGVKMEEVAATAAKLRQNIQSAREGNAGMVASLAQLNLTAAGLQALAPERQWELIATRIARATDRQAALNAAADLFGAKNAPKMLEMLQRLGVEGYDKLAQGTEKIRLSEEQLKTLDDAGDKLGRIVDHLKYIAAKGTVSVLAGAGVGGSLSVVEQSFNDNEIERAKALIEIWTAKGNTAMAEAWRANLARLQAAAVADPYSERNAARTAGTAAAAEAARKAEYDAASQWEETRKQIAEGVKNYGETLKLNLEIERAAGQQARHAAAVNSAKEREAALAREKLALAQAEQVLSSKLAAGQAAIARLESDPRLLTVTRQRAMRDILAAQNQAIAERIALLEKQQEAGYDPTRQGQIDGLRGDAGVNSQAIADNTPKSAGYGAMSGMVEYLNSIPDAAGRAQQAVLGIAQAMEQGIATSLRGLIDGTMTWADALANIGNTVINAVIGAFVNMAAQWIVQQIVMAVAGKAIQAAQVAALAPLAAATALIWAPAATAASIATFGGAAVSGHAMAQSLIWASAVGLAEGGPVSGPGTGTSDDVPAWLSNGEYVMPAAETAKYRPLLDAMRAGTLDGAAPALAATAPGASPVTVGGTQINLAMFDGRMAADKWARSAEGEAHILDIVARNFHRIGSAA